MLSPAIALRTAERLAQCICLSDQRGRIRSTDFVRLRGGVHLVNERIDLVARRSNVAAGRRRERGVQLAGEAVRHALTEPKSLNGRDQVADLLKVRRERLGERGSTDL